MIRRPIPVFALICLSFAPLLPSVQAAPNDVGEIALVEDVDGTIATSVAMPDVYLSKIACAFYLTHNDQYDGIFVFTAEQLNFISNTQQGWPVCSPSQGIGRGWPCTNGHKRFCSTNQRLRQAVKMGSIDTLPNNPDDRYTGIPMYALSGIELVAHEFGHQWGISIKYDKGDGQGQQCMVRGWEFGGDEGGAGQTGDPCGLDTYEGEYNQHWSYYFNSQSLMYGSFIEDNGDGTFKIWYAEPKYGPFDQYIMGLRRANEVEPSFHVIPPNDNLSGSASLPMRPTDGVGEITGTKVEVTIEDVIRVMGKRDPELEECHWKAAFIIVHPVGQPPTPQQIAKVDLYRQRWEEFYDYATDNRGSFDTTLSGCGVGTPTCVGKTDAACGQVCTEKERRCSGQVLVEECVDNAWTFSQECIDQVCREGECVPRPVDGDESDGDGDAPADGDEAPDGDDPTTPDGDKDREPPVDGDDPIDGDGAPDGDDSAEGEVPAAEFCTPQAARCQADLLQTCSSNGRTWLTSANCAESGQSCVEGQGCVGSGSGSGCAQIPFQLGLAGFLLLLAGALGRWAKARARLRR